MKVKIIVTLKDGVLDPQGKAIQQTLSGMNFSNVNEVRQGKFFEIEVNEKNVAKAKSQAEEMVKALDKKKIPYTYQLYKGEQHGFRKTENIIRSLESELLFYGSIFGFHPTDKIPPINIYHL